MNASEQQGHPPAPRRILVVDDNPVLGRLLEVVLKREGFDVSVFRDPEEALLEAMEHPPSLVLCDYEMDHLDGTEVCLHLKSQRATKDVPFILMSGKWGNEGHEIARFSGAVEYLSKPFMPDHLAFVVRRLMVIPHNSSQLPEVC